MIARARLRPLLVILFGSCMVVFISFPAAAVVRFGSNVYVGGHNFSHQRYDRKHRAVIHLYDRRPPRQGCIWRADGRGGRVKTCHLQRIRR